MQKGVKEKCKLFGDRISIYLLPSSVPVRDGVYKTSTNGGMLFGENPIRLRHHIHFQRRQIHEYIQHASRGSRPEGQQQ